MSRVETRLEELGLVLPEPMTPPGNFKLVNVHGGLAFIAGHPAIDGSTILVEGVVGTDLSIEEGYRAARLAGLAIIASLKQELGDLDRVTKWLRALGHPQTGPDFPGTPGYVNGLHALTLRPSRGYCPHAR